jgi:S-adenosylhomocysteine hydrolase
MRKELKLEFEDPVIVEFKGHHDLETAIAAHKEHIMRETHARDLVKKPELEGGQKWVVNKMPLELAVRKA